MDPVTMAALIQGGTSLFNQFSGQRDARKNRQQMGQIQGYGREAYNPFIQQGQQAGQQLSPMYQQQMNNPTGQYNDIMSQYQPSQGYQYKQDKLNQMMHNTAASGGYAGTGGDQQQRGELTNALMGEDMQQFLQNILGIQSTGMKGLEGQAERGYGAAGNLADYMGNAAGAQVGSNMFGQANNQGNRNDASSILSGLIGGGNKGANFDEIFKMFGKGGGGNTTAFTPLTSASSFGKGGYNPSWLGS